MKTTVVYALLIAAAMTSSALANSGSNPTSNGVDKILQGHGSSGDTAKSTSNPDVSYRVLANGDIEKANSRYNRVEITKPSWWLGMSPRQRDSWAGR
ncbi:hypothetical protein [Mesorhizobium sp. 2RAF21]|jgi:hypothetical protein|uniref:hypothetical protein n=1 Tax=Mesorhizobium sp. 2RAF21 TaxID=3232995 RepID=UPI003F96DC98